MATPTTVGPAEAMVLAAGRSVRLGPLTAGMPKPLLDVGGRPCIEWILLWLKHHGIARVRIKVHYLPDALMARIGDGSLLGLHASYLHGDYQTADWMARDLDSMAETFVLHYGDTLNDSDLGALLTRHRAVGEPHVTLGLARMCGLESRGVAEMQNGLVTWLDEKPAVPRSGMAFAGTAVIDREAIRNPRRCFVRAGDDFARDLVPRIINRRIAVLAHEMIGTVIDIGTPTDLEEARRRWPTPRMLAMTGATA